MGVKDASGTLINVVIWVLFYLFIYLFCLLKQTTGFLLCVGFVLDEKYATHYMWAYL